MATSVRQPATRSTRVSHVPLAWSNNRFGQLGSNIVVGSLFHNVNTLFDRNLLLPRDSCP